MGKVNKNSMKESMKIIGVRGTFLRGLDYFAENLFSYSKITHRYLKRKYGRAIQGDQYKEIPINDTKNIIWVCWFQGMENAPDLVQRCFDSLKKQNPEREIVVVTEQNMRQYISLPYYIWEKYERGIIKRTTFSDILRLALLYQNGGMWVDSTLFFTEQIPQTIFDEEIFIFKGYAHLSAVQISSSQFLYCKNAGNEIVGRALFGMCEYYRRENSLINWFLCHYLVYIAAKSNENTRRIWDLIPIRDSIIHHTLQFLFWEKYKPAEWEYIKRLSFMHKLSYKHLTEENCKKEDTYYKCFMEGKLC